MCSGIPASEHSFTAERFDLLGMYKFTEGAVGRKKAIVCSCFGHHLRAAFVSHISQVFRFLVVSTCLYIQ